MGISYPTFIEFWRRGPASTQSIQMCIFTQTGQ